MIGMQLMCCVLYNRHLLKEITCDVLVKMFLFCFNITSAEFYIFFFVFTAKLLKE